MNAFERGMIAEDTRDDRLGRRVAPHPALPANDAVPLAPPTVHRVVLPLAPSLERRRLRSHLMLLVLDAAVIFGGFVAISMFYFGTWDEAATMRLASMLLPLYWTAAAATQVYSTHALTHQGFAQRRSATALLLALGVVLFVAFLAKASDQFSRLSAAAGVLLVMVGLIVVRWATQPLLRRKLGPNAENVLVIDDGGAAVRVPHAFHVDASQLKLSPDLNDPHMLDRVGMFMTNMDRVLVTCPPGRALAWSLIFKGANIQGEIVDPQVLALGALGARRGRDFGALVVSTGPLGLRARLLKRGFEVAFATAAIVALSPLLAAVALAIWLEDRGPVFFIQLRTGRNNRFFPIYKFRSMRVEKLDPSGDRSASRDDDRVTRIGRFIRRTSIDELPQLLNVLRGQMSVVGPRPHAIGSQAGEKLFWEVDERYWLRHSLKPGLTGLAQVRGLRGATDHEDDLAGRLNADLEYIAGWSLWRDIRIVVATMRVLIHDRAF